MTYDQWKCDSGYDEREECDHDEYEIDWEGRINCDYCGAFLRYATTEDMDQHAEWEREYHEAMERDERRQRLLAPWYWLKSFFIWRKRKPLDDEIPF